MSKRKAKAGMKSRDGRKTITVRQFERLFDQASDEIDDYIDWSAVMVESPPRKKPVALRLDADVLEWFQASGKGYQTRINAVLRSYKRACEKVKP